MGGFDSGLGKVAAIIAGVEGRARGTASNERPIHPKQEGAMA